MRPARPARACFKMDKPTLKQELCVCLLAMTGWNQKFDLATWPSNADHPDQVTPRSQQSHDTKSGRKTAEVKSQPLQSAMVLLSSLRRTQQLVQVRKHGAKGPLFMGTPSCYEPLASATCAVRDKVLWHEDARLQNLLTNSF